MKIRGRQKPLHTLFPLSKGHKYPKATTRVYNIISHFCLYVNTFLQKNLVYNRKGGKICHSFRCSFLVFMTNINAIFTFFHNICHFLVPSALYFVVFSGFLDSFS
jgi:hypothetical protein